MFRSSFIFALMALLTAALFAAPANAHGSARQISSATTIVVTGAANRIEATAGFLTSEGSTAAVPLGNFTGYFVTDGSSQLPEGDCPEAIGGCCSAQCCVGKHLVFGIPGVGSVFAAASFAMPGTRSPADATPEIRIKPPRR